MKRYTKRITSLALAGSLIATAFCTPALAATLTITYDSQGSNMGTFTETDDSEYRYTPSSMPLKSGYIFDYWTYELDGESNKAGIGAPIAISNSITSLTLTAQYTPMSERTLQMGDNQVTDASELYELIYAFTPAKTAIYHVSSSENNDKDSDPVLYIYDAEGNYVKRMDDSDDSYNFDGYAVFTAGSTYYFALFNYTKADTYTLNISADFPLTDVSGGSWYAPYVVTAYEEGLMKGKSSTTFAPMENVVRAQFAVILKNMDDAFVPMDASTGFSDVAAGAWYTDAILWAKKNGIVKGYGNGTFGVNDPITREQIAIMLYQYFGSNMNSDDKTEMMAFYGEQDYYKNFTDSSKVSSWAAGAINWAIDYGVLSGKTNADGKKRLDPQGYATRAECAKMIVEFYQIIKSGNVV